MSKYIDITAIAHIKNVETDEIRKCPTQIWKQHGYIDPYMWAEGNYGCDCNRQLFFERANGAIPEWDDFSCGNERYKVNLEVDKEIVYREFGEEKCMN